MPRGGETGRLTDAGQWRPPELAESSGSRVLLLEGSRSASGRHEQARHRGHKLEGTEVALLHRTMMQAMTVLSSGFACVLTVSL